jgi:hypothetical protein
MAATTGQGALLQEIHGGGECQMARSRSFPILSSFNISMKIDQHFDGELLFHPPMSLAPLFDEAVYFEASDSVMQHLKQHLGGGDS